MIFCYRKFLWGSSVKCFITSLYTCSYYFRGGFELVVHVLWTNLLDAYRSAGKGLMGDTPSMLESLAGFFLLL
jgi:hypothetical protein